MTIKEKLKKAQKKAKTTIVTGALAMAAVAAPIKGQSAEATIDTAPAQTTEVTPAQKQRQQMFETCVAMNMPKEEVIKYMDFPEFLPVTKEGQFDEDKANKWSKQLAPYMETLAKKQSVSTVTEAYEAFKQATGQESVSVKDFARVCEVAQKAADKYHNETGVAFKIIPPIAALVAGILCLGSAMGTGAAISDIKKYDNWDGLGGGILCGVLAAAFGIGAVAAGGKAFEAWTKKPQEAIYEVYKQTYASYIDQSIQNQKEAEKKDSGSKETEWKQAMQMFQKANEGKR